MTSKETIKDMCIISSLTALGIVLSAFCQIPIFSNIKIDLSYVVIIVVCYVYGGIIGGFTAMTIAMLESSLFTSLGFSISWSIANLFVGLVCGLIFQLTKKMNKKWIKNTLNIIAIILSVAIAMLFIKTGIECKLYAIPFEVKIIKNSVAFGVDTFVCLLGYFSFVPLVTSFIKREVRK